MLYNCRISFIMKYCTVFKLEIILSTESEMVWPCESTAEGSDRLYAYGIAQSARWAHLSTSQASSGRAFRRGLNWPDEVMKHTILRETCRVKKHTILQCEY